MTADEAGRLASTPSQDKGTLIKLDARAVGRLSGPKERYPQGPRLLRVAGGPRRMKCVGRIG